MAGFAGDDPFDFQDYRDGDELCYDPLDCGGGGGGEEFCVSGFAVPDGDDIPVVDHASQSSHEEPILETLSRSFDSDGGLSQFLPHLVSALDLAEDTSEEKDVAGDSRGGSGFAVSGFDFERGPVIDEAAAADDDGSDGLGLMLSEFTLDPRPVVGGFQTLVGADEEDAGGDDMGQRGGLMLSGLDLGPPQVAGTFRMVVDAEDTDSDDADVNLLEVLAGRVGEARAQRLPASRAVVEGLPEVALSEEEASHGCPVCKDGIAVGESVVRLPCKHYFHGECIRPWLAIRNTCPVCRYELPTGNAEYDRRRSRTGVTSVARPGAPAQSGGAGAGAGGRATVVAGDATECSAENGLGQSASR